jgi:hypothetical protein
MAFGTLSVDDADGRSGAVLGRKRDNCEIVGVGKDWGRQAALLILLVLNLHLESYRFAKKDFLALDGKTIGLCLLLTMADSKLTVDSQGNYG